MVHVHSSNNTSTNLSCTQSQSTKHTSQKRRNSSAGIQSKNLYTRLGLKKNGTLNEIKKAYHRLSLIHHPDHGGLEANYKLLSEAYEILSDPVKRERYDRTGAVTSEEDWVLSKAAELVKWGFTQSDNPIKMIQSQLSKEYSEILMKSISEEALKNKLKRRLDKFRKDNPTCERVIELIEATVEAQAEKLRDLDELKKKVTELRNFFDGIKETSNDSKESFETLLTRMASQ